MFDKISKILKNQKGNCLIVSVIVLSIIAIILFLPLFFSWDEDNTEARTPISNKEYYYYKKRLEENKDILKKIYQTGNEARFAMSYIGFQFPTLSFQNINQKNISLSIDKNMIISFFKSDNTNLGDNFSYLDKMAKEMNVTFVPVFVFESEDNLKYLLKKYPQEILKKSLFIQNEALIKNINLRESVTTFFVDSNNNINLVRENGYPELYNFKKDFRIAFTEKIRKEDTYIDGYGNIHINYSYEYGVE